MHELRPYQRAAIDAVFEYWAKEGGSPLLDLATGVGKSVVIATLLRELYESYPQMRVLVLVHVRELVQQDHQALVRAWPSAPAGINSAGLGRRDLRHPILFASIQSVHRYAHAMGHRDLVLIDEAHLVPKAGDGMYQALFKDMRSINPDLRVFGCTATPYRLDSGRLDRGKDRFFDKTVYSYGIGEGVRDGYLSPLISKGMATEIDVASVARRGGEFVPGALEEAADREEVTRAAVDELVQYGAERRSWLVFCSGLKHADHVAQEIRSRGISVAVVTGKTPKAERAATLEAFKAGRIRCITNVSVLTTGFDAPGVDLVALLRPTLSTGLYVQMLGRGTRLAPGKRNCLVLDFSGNVRRHGPVDHVRVQSSGGGRGEGEAGTNIESVRAKPCLHCMTYSPIQARECAECGTAFTEEVKYAATADSAPILSGKIKDGWDDVSDVKMYPHMRRGGEGTPTIRVEYGLNDSVGRGFRAHREWLCPEHTGIPAKKFASWWLGKGGKVPVPSSVEEAIRRFDAKELKNIVAVKVQNDGEYDRVIGWRCVPRDFDLFGQAAE